MGCKTTFKRNELTKEDRTTRIDEMSSYPTISKEVLRDIANSTYRIVPSKTETELRAKLAEEKAEDVEWIWVDGYKGTDKNMVCRDYQFAIGEMFEMPKDAKIETCESGFHFCCKLENVFTHYQVSNGNRFFKVKGLVRKSDLENNALKLASSDPWMRATASMTDKLAAKAIIFMSELSHDEILQAKGVDIDGWTKEDKALAIEKGPGEVVKRFNTQKLIAQGYSRHFAEYLVRSGKFDVAYAVGSQEDLSMDFKVMAIFTNDD